MNSRHTRREQPRRAKFLAFETLESRDLLAAVAAPSGLIAWWTGDGNARDAMGGNNGILEGGASFATGKVGQAFSLDGVDDRVRIPNGAVLNPVQGLTIEAWVLLNSTNSNGQVIVSKWNDLTSDRSFIFKDQPICCKTGGGLFERTRIQLLGTNNIGIADETNLTNITVGQWTHVAVTYDTHTLKLFF